MRINGDYQELLVKLCEGNVGALTTLIKVSQHSRYAPAMLAFFEHNEIRGEKIWILYKDVCKEDFKELESLFHQYLQNELSVEEIMDMIEKSR